MTKYLQAIWARLVVEEKLLVKSATLYLAYAIASLPVVLPYLQTHFAEYSQFIPVELRSKVMYWIAVAIALCRLRSMLPPLPSQAAPAPSSPGASQP